MSYQETTLRPYDAENPVDAARLAQSAADSYKQVGGTQAIINGMAKHGIEINRAQAYDALYAEAEAKREVSLKPLASALGIVLFALAFFASPASAMESKPCKEKHTTTTTARPHNYTTTTTAKPKHHSVTTTIVKPTTTTTTIAKPQQLSRQEVTTTTVRPTTTTVDVATPEQVETTGEVNADDSIQPVQFVSASQPTELAHTGAMTTRLALFAAALCGIGWVVLWIKSRITT